MKSATPRRIILCATTDLSYDQRMARIAGSLHAAGYDVTLVGRERAISRPLRSQPYRQHRLPMRRVDSTKLFYFLFWVKLFFWIMRQPRAAVCAADLDTILPVWLASKLRGLPRVYDAHELFADQEEVLARPFTRWLWQTIERFVVPRFPHGYTVSESYVEVFRKRYDARYSVVRNATVLKPFTIPQKTRRYILYQGAVNWGRCFESLIPAMKNVDCELVIVGEGNFMQQAQALVAEHNLGHRVIFKGYVPPHELPLFTAHATIGITLFVPTSLSNELSLANRFFDYMHHAVPQLGVRYPEYARINAEYPLAVLLDEVTPDTVSTALNKMLADRAGYDAMQQACLRAREVYCWQREEERLLTVWREAFGDA